MHTQHTLHKCGFIVQQSQKASCVKNYIRNASKSVSQKPQKRLGETSVLSIMHQLCVDQKVGRFTVDFVEIFPAKSTSFSAMLACRSRLNTVLTLGRERILQENSSLVFIVFCEERVSPLLCRGLAVNIAPL